MYFVFMIVLVVVFAAQDSETLSNWLKRRSELKSSELEIKKIEAKAKLLRLKENLKHKEFVD